MEEVKPTERSFQEPSTEELMNNLKTIASARFSKTYNQDSLVEQLKSARLMMSPQSRGSR